MERLENIVFYSIDKAIRTYRQFAQQQLRLQGYEMTVDQWIVMQCIIENPEVSQTEIAEKVFKDNASVTRIVSLLVKAKYLSRKIMPSNRRRVILKITELGHKTLEGMQEIINNNRAAALDGISAEEIDLLKRITAKITSNCSNNH